jgi:hypothetical protein
MCDTTTLMQILGFGVLALALIGGTRIGNHALLLHDRRVAQLKANQQRALDETERTQLLLDRLDAERAYSEAEAAKAHKKT